MTTVSTKYILFMVFVIFPLQGWALFGKAGIWLRDWAVEFGERIK